MNTNDFWLDKIEAAMHLLAAKSAELREENRELLLYVRGLEEANNLLVSQRDEARSMYCHAVSGGTVTPAKIAHQNGWDCFNTEV